MITKNIFKYLAACFVCCGLSVAFTSCSSDEDPFFSASEDDYPRIINTDLPEGKGGEPAALPSIERTTNFTCEVIVTPVHYTTVTWFVDDEQVGEGLKIDVPVLAGDHLVKVVATTTKGLSTYRLLPKACQPIVCSHSTSVLLLVTPSWPPMAVHVGSLLELQRP